jgi:hypothetical protein
MSFKSHFAEPLESRRLLSFAVGDYDMGITSSPMLTVVADFNNDLVPDLALATSNDPGSGSAVSVLPGNANGTFGAARTSVIGLPLAYARTASIAAADFNGDGNVDLAAANFYDHAIGFPTVVLGNGDGTFQDPRQSVGLALPPPPPGHYLYSLSTTDVAVADANADGVPDLLFTGEVWFNDYPGEGPYLYGYTAASLGRGDGTFAAAFGVLSPDPLFQSPAVDIEPADLNADGKVDMVAANGARYGQGDGTFGEWQAFSGAQGDRVAIGDFNGDGKIDVAATINSGGGGGFIRLGNGDGSVQAAQSYVSGPRPRSVATADFNGDGKTDLVTANGDYSLNIERSLTVCLGNGNGTFQSPLSFPITPSDSSRPSHVAVADFNGDGRPDIAVATHVFAGDDYENLRVLLNDGNWTTRTFVGPGGAGSGGNWSAAANWSPSGVPTAGDVVTISGKSVNLAASTRVGGLNLLGGATLTLGANGARVLRATSLSISPNSKLNLNDNSLIIDYGGAGAGASPIGAWNGTAYTGITGLLAAGRTASGTWNGGGGIGTSMPHALEGVTGLAVAEAADVRFLSGSQTALWEGQTVDATTVIVTYTYVGDANFDGLVDGADYGRIDNYIQFPGTRGYANGDFNFDGVIDGADYGYIDNSIQLQGPAL